MSEHFAVQRGLMFTKVIFVDVSSIVIMGREAFSILVAFREFEFCWCFAVVQELPAACRISLC